MPIVKHVKSHMIGIIDGILVKPEHHLNERADDVAKAAAAELAQNPSHALTGLPRFCLTDMITGSPVNHHARHEMTKRSQEGTLDDWAQSNRTHGQLLRWNKDRELIKAAAKHTGNTPNMRKPDKLRMLALTHQIPVPKIKVRRGDPDYHGYIESTITCNHRDCAADRPQLDPVHLVMGKCHERMWRTARHVILQQTERTRADENTHKDRVAEGEIDTNTGQPAKEPKDGYLPMEIPWARPAGPGAKLAEPPMAPEQG